MRNNKFNNQWRKPKQRKIQSKRNQQSSKMKNQLKFRKSLCRKPRSMLSKLRKSLKRPKLKNQYRRNQTLMRKLLSLLRSNKRKKFKLRRPWKLKLRRTMS